MVRRLWRVVKQPAYRRGVEGHGVPIEPERRIDALEGCEGLWVAVKDGRVIAGAHSSSQLVRQVIEMGPDGEGAVAQFVPNREDAIVIGVG